MPVEWAESLERERQNLWHEIERIPVLLPPPNLSPQPPLSEGTSPDDAQKLSDIVGRLVIVFADKAQYRRMLKCRGPQAQRHLDLFQMLLDMHHLEPQFRRNLVVAARRLSSEANLYPKCFDLPDVQPDSEIAVASGGFADIYKGHLCGQLVCLKVIRVYQTSDTKDIIKAFSREAVLWGQLSHPNLLPFCGMCKFRSQLCLVSPWAENGTVLQYLKRNPTAGRALLSLDVAAAVSYLHSLDIVHGDIKGVNILVDDSGRARLSDFGLSAVTDPEILNWTSHSCAASKGGSVRWQAPELFDLEIDDVVLNNKPTDVYALSCVCYEIFTGNVPFHEFARDALVMYQIKQGKKPSLPPKLGPPWSEWGLTDDICTLIQNAWNADPADRPIADQFLAQFTIHTRNRSRTAATPWDYTFRHSAGSHLPSKLAFESMLSSEGKNKTKK